MDPFFKQWSLKRYGNLAAILSKKFGFSFSHFVDGFHLRNIGFRTGSGWFIQIKCGNWDDNLRQIEHRKETEHWDKEYTGGWNECMPLAEKIVIEGRDKMDRHWHLSYINDRETGGLRECNPNEITSKNPEVRGLDRMELERISKEPEFDYHKKQ